MYKEPQQLKETLTAADIAAQLLDTLTFALDRNPQAAFWCQNKYKAFCLPNGGRGSQEEANLNPDGAGVEVVSMRLLEAVRAGVFLFAWCPAQAGLVALDLDRHEDKPDGIANLAHWLSGWLWPGDVLPTWATDPTTHPAHVRTPGGGFHLYFQGVGLSKKVAVAESVELMSGPSWLAAPGSYREGKAPGLYALHGTLENAPRLADCKPLQRAIQAQQHEAAQRAAERAEVRVKQASRPLVADRGQASPETVAGWVEQDHRTAAGRDEAAFLYCQRLAREGYSEEEILQACYQVGQVLGHSLTDFDGSWSDRELQDKARRAAAVR